MQRLARKKFLPFTVIALFSLTLVPRSTLAELEHAAPVLGSISAAATLYSMAVTQTAAATATVASLTATVGELAVTASIAVTEAEAAEAEEAAACSGPQALALCVAATTALAAAVAGVASAAQNKSNGDADLANAKQNLKYWQSEKERLGKELATLDPNGELQDRDLGSQGYQEEKLADAYREVPQNALNGLQKETPARASSANGSTSGGSGGATPGTAPDTSLQKLATNYVSNSDLTSVFVSKQSVGQNASPTQTALTALPNTSPSRVDPAGGSAPVTGIPMRANAVVSGAPVEDRAHFISYHSGGAEIDVVGQEVFPMSAATFCGPPAGNEVASQALDEMIEVLDSSSSHPFNRVDPTARTVRTASPFL